MWSNIALFLCVLPLAERRLGTRRTVIVFFLCDWASTVLALVGLRIAALLHDQDADRLLLMRDAGPSSGAWALAIVVGGYLPSRFARVATTSAIGTFLAFALVVHHRLFDVQHALAALAGLIALQIFNRRAVTETPGGGSAASAGSIGSRRRDEAPVDR